MRIPAGSTAWVWEERKSLCGDVLIRLSDPGLAALSVQNGTSLGMLWSNLLPQRKMQTPFSQQWGFDSAIWPGPFHRAPALGWDFTEIKKRC